jgi:hypothetical protein
MRIENDMTSHSLRSSLPDYYGDERRALDRVRNRQAIRWLGFAVAGFTFVIWQIGR